MSDSRYGYLIGYMPNKFSHAFALLLLMALCTGAFAQTQGGGKADTAKNAPANHKFPLIAGGPWSLASAPDVQNPHRTAGRVVINFTIDTDGHIIQALADPRRTTITDTALIKLCETAVKNIKLTGPAHAPQVQKAQMTFKFDVN